MARITLVSRFDLLAATVEQARALALRGASEEALLLLSTDLDAQRRETERMLAERSTRQGLAAVLGVTPQAVSKRYPGIFGK